MKKILESWYDAKSWEIRMAPDRRKCLFIRLRNGKRIDGEVYPCDLHYEISEILQTGMDSFCVVLGGKNLGSILIKRIELKNGNMAKMPVYTCPTNEKPFFVSDNLLYVGNEYFLLPSMMTVRERIVEKMKEEDEDCDEYKGYELSFDWQDEKPVAKLHFYDANIKAALDVETLTPIEVVCKHHKEYTFSSIDELIKMVYSIKRATEIYESGEYCVPRCSVFCGVTKPKIYLSGRPFYPGNMGISLVWQILGITPGFGNWFSQDWQINHDSLSSSIDRMIDKLLSINGLTEAGPRHIKMDGVFEYDRDKYIVTVTRDYVTIEDLISGEFYLYHNHDTVDRCLGIRQIAPGTFLILSRRKNYEYQLGSYMYQLERFGIGSEQNVRRRLEERVWLTLPDLQCQLSDNILRTYSKEDGRSLYLIDKNSFAKTRGWHEYFERPLVVKQDGGDEENRRLIYFKMSFMHPSAILYDAETNEIIGKYFNFYHDRIEESSPGQTVYDFEKAMRDEATQVEEMLSTIK